MVIVDGGVGYSQSNDITFTILSESGSSAELSGVLDSKGSLTGITIVSGGTDYSPEDMILTNSPLSFDVGQTIIISARVNDPLGEMDRVEFYGNGVELNNVLQNQNIDDDLYQIQYTIPDQGLEFISVRALYGDGRDDGPSIPVGYSSKKFNEQNWCGQGHWGWSKHWVQQHCLPSDYVCPPWFWGNVDYWPWPPPWRSTPYWHGASAIDMLQIKEAKLPYKPEVGTIYPRVKGSRLTFSTKERRNKNGSSMYSSINGIGAEYLNQVTTGQRIRFSNGIQVSDEVYEIHRVSSNNALELVSTLSPGDQTLIANWDELQLVPVYRAGSLVALALKDETEYTQFSSVEFFIDGVNIGTDTAWPFSTTWVPQEDGNFTLSVVATSAEGIQELHIEKLYVEELIGMPLMVRQL